MQIFNNYKSDLPYKEFMDRLKKVITHEQFQQLSNDILREVESNQQEYYETNHATIKEARNKFHSLSTYIMMCKVGYILDKSLSESKKKMETLS